MKFQRPRQRSETETMIPLINVVFLLLIFFMIAGAISKTPPFEWQAPESKSEARPDNAALVVHVARDGRLALNGEAVTLDELATSLSKDQSATAGPVQVKADQAVEAKRVMAVMARLRDAGLAKVRLVTRKVPGD